jgi:transketolase
MTVMHPCDDLSAEVLTIKLADYTSPSYTRTARNKTPRIYDKKSAAALEIGKGSVLRAGKDVAILACGVMVSKALTAADNLSGGGIEATVVDMHTIKPLDEELLARLADECGCFVTSEDHSIIGGLGGAVAEYLSGSTPLPLERVGVKDHYGESGDGEELLTKYGMSSDDIAIAAQRAIERK